MDELMEITVEDSHRKLEDVCNVISLAKLSDSDLKPVSQALFFSEKDNSPLKLLELDPHVLQNIEEGQTLVIRGAEDDEAVLCTEDTTYEIRGAETSNSLLLLPDLLLADDMNAEEGENRILKEKMVLSVVHNYYELRKCIPRTNKIPHLLEGSSFRGKEHENESSMKLYTFDDLLDHIQCSTKELMVALSEMEAYNIDGYWRFLEFDYNFRVLTYILNVVEENSWPLNQVHKKVTLDSLSDLVPLEIVDQCFEYYCEPTGNSADDGKFNLEEFLEAWQQSVPEGMMTSVKQLEGLALVDTNERPPVARYFPESDLPEDPGKRFELLFHTKDKWTLEEITPYIERLAPNKASVSSLLMRYARTYQAPNGKG
ncbi:hypothetical protein J437_LFUL002162, partial [Ladona fulva]